MKAKELILQTGASALREKAKPVAHKDISSTKIKNLLKRMSAALAPEKNGVALAAPQVGAALRIFIVAGRVFEDEKESETKQAQKVAHQKSSEQAGQTFASQLSAPASHDMVFINPEFVRVSRKKREMSEGCLSVRDVYGTVLRHEKASVRALDQ